MPSSAATLPLDRAYREAAVWLLSFADLADSADNEPLAARYGEQPIFLGDWRGEKTAAGDEVDVLVRPGNGLILGLTLVTTDPESEDGTSSPQLGLATQDDEEQI